MDESEINAMNKKELVAELKRLKLPHSGNKSALKIRLHEHVNATVIQRHDKQSDDSDDGSGDSDEEGEDTFVRINKIEKELQEKLAELDALRASVQSSTRVRAQVPKEKHKTTSKRAMTVPQHALSTAHTRADNARAEVNDSERHDDARMTLHEDERGACGESGESANRMARTEPIVRQRNTMSSAFSFRDIEDSLSTFSGDDPYTIMKWVNDTERSSRLFNWNELQLLMYAQRLLKGTAKKFVRTIEADSWEELKEYLIEQFDIKLSDADIHRKMGERKKNSKETLQQYLIAMSEIGKANNVEEISIMQYVIDGIDDEPRNKSMLYGACTMREFRMKLIAYEKFRSSYGQKKESRREPREWKGEIKQSGEKPVPFKNGEMKCFACGETGHIGAKCPHKNEGEKCFACNQFGHRSNACPNKEKKVMMSSSKTVGDMYKTIKINDCVVSALIDTGCDLNLIREDAAKCFNIQVEDERRVLGGLGGKQSTTIGSFMAKVTIDDAEFETKFFIVENNAMAMLAIVGKELMTEAEVNIRNNMVFFKRAKEEINYLMNIRVEEINAESEQNVPPAVRSLIENYSPKTTSHGDIELKIHLTDEIPVYYRPRRLTHGEKEIVEKQMEEWLANGTVIECASEYASPLTVKKKKDGSARVCMDYRGINKKMIKDKFPVPLIEDQLDALQEARVFSTIDLKNAYFHVPVNKESQKYLAFITHNKQFTFLKTPFGCSNSPRIFQRFINHVFRDLIMRKIIMIYVDDIIILAKDEEEAMTRLKMVLTCAQESGLEIKWKKCQFLKKSVEFVGYIIEDGTIKPSPGKTNAVQKFPEPRTIKQVQSFLGLTGYFRKFIAGYATIARPLSDMLRKDTSFAFKDEERRAFEQLKRCLMQDPVLKIYDQKAETELHTDASKFGFGAVLLQRSNDDQQLHPVYYMSAKTSPAEEKYDSYTLETLAVVKALQKFRVYLLDKEFKIVTDCDALKKTMSKRDVNYKVARYVEYMQDFTFEIVHRSGDRMKHVDSLSRNAVMMVSEEENIAAKIKSLQKEDDDLKHIFTILEKQPYEDFMVRNGILFKYHEGYEILVVPKSMEEEVIKIAHENGHFGMKKMEQQIRQRYYIKALKEKMQKCIKTCVACILADNKQGKGEGYLHPIEKEETPLQTYHIDHVGPMVATCKMYRYIFIVVDSFTKFTWLYPTKTTNAKEVLNKLRAQQMIFGNPRRIISDKGAAFTSKEFEDYCKEEDIMHARTTTGMPRANGQVERINRSIIPVLTKAAMIEPDKWYKHVPYVQQALNSTYQRSIATTPFELMIGTPMKRKEDIEMVKLLEENFAIQFKEKRNELRDAAKEQIMKIQNENKRTFNRRRKTPNRFNVGQLIAIKRTQFVNGNKLAAKFLGPYRVTKVKRNDRYDVIKEGNHEGPKITSTGVENMKRWCHNSSESDEENDGRV